MKSKSMSNQLGADAEKVAYKFLKTNGLKLLSNNYHCRFGELDLVMKDGQAIVFIEVKYRINACYGVAQEFVTVSKQQKIIKSAHCFLQNYGIETNSSMIRFDIIAFNGRISLNNVHWIKSAFIC